MKKALAMALAVMMMGTTVYGAEQKEQAKAIPVSQEVSLDGHTEKMQGYNIDGYTYFRLRDMAEQVTEHIIDSNHHFGISYNDDTKKINLIRPMDYESLREGEPYMIGSEIEIGIPAEGQFTINDNDLGKYAPKGYVIDGYTFYKMRDFALMMSLDIEWNEGERVIEITSIQDDAAAN